ncbi:MAG TPA: transposase [Noviherbaspirillum sp.]
MRYRRDNIAGGTYFFTVNLAQRSSTLLIDAIDILRDAMRLVQRRHPFHIDAIVILPDHLHTIWTLPPDDAAFAQRWALIKAEFSRHLPPTERRSASRQKKGERGIWQRRYWEHLIRSDADYARHVDYIHLNPVKHGHAAHPREWAYSSIHRYVRDGILPPDWSSDLKMEDRLFGEA